MKNSTYSVQANNCNHPKITYAEEGLCIEDARIIAYRLSMAFREVIVTCEETGEVMYSYYYTDDFEKPITTEDNCIRCLRLR